MAATSKGRALTEKHRLDQAEVVARATNETRKALERALRGGGGLDELDQAMVQVSSGVIFESWQVSQALASRYVEEFSLAETGKVVPAPRTPRYDKWATYRSLFDAAMKAYDTVKAKGYPEEKALESASKAALGRTNRVVADTSRDVIARSTHMPRVVGWVRVPDADPCAFCAMLASRGVVSGPAEFEPEGLYNWGSFVDSNEQFKGSGLFKVHDWCQCTMEPVYKESEGGYKYPPGTEQLSKEWQEIAKATNKRTGDTPFNAFRRWRDSGTLPKGYEGKLTSSDRHNGKFSDGQE